jgi:serine/threonine-protein kinase
MIGRYAVRSRIGRGGMGMVYRALDETLQREVALKILTLEGVFDEESRQRFTVEARAAAQLQHPNIVTIFELGEERGVPFIAMELLPGTDLESLMRSGEKLLLAEKLDILAQVCRGLAYAHEHHIVHRDVKPSNIRLLDEGGVKIMDFGIAKLGATHLTRAGIVVGTVYYMSPEQVRGQPLDGRSDIFSAGVVLHELLTGARPFEGTSATEVLHKILNAPPPGLPQGADPADGQLAAILERALAKTADQRFPGAAAMADALVEAEARLAERAPRASDETVHGRIGAARRALKEGRGEEGLAALEALVREHPTSVDARRALRATRRQQAQATGQPTAILDDGFPELAATFQVPPTRRAAETVRAEPPAPAGVEGRAGRKLGWLWLGAALVGLAVVAGVLLLLLRGGGAGTARLRIRSQPPGARVLVDGRDIGVVTDGDVVLDGKRSPVVLTLRKEGYREAQRSVTLPLGDDQPLTVPLTPVESELRVVSEPAGAEVRLDGAPKGVTPLAVPLDRSQAHRLEIALEGYRTRTQALPAGSRETELAVRLEPAGPPAQVAISSTYPVDVLWNGKTLARGQVSPRVELAPGRQTLTLLSSRLSLKTSVTVEGRAGSVVSLAAPGLGRINIQARPDNCEVLIDGVFVDYPPILDRPIAAGAHRVQFKWPDGGRAEEAVEVVEARTVFVFGRPQ